MKRILFVINSLTIGGSEKSLVSLLNSIDYSKYKVDLLMLKKGEEFDRYIPKEVNILEAPKYYRYLNGEKIKLTGIERLRFNICKYKCSLELRLNGKVIKFKNNQQIFYENQKSIIENLKTKYDVAIAYAQGFPTYFVADKVVADKKLAWINCDYVKTAYDKKLDEKYYNKIDKIIAVSEHGKDSIVSVNKKYKNKIEIIKDIVNPKVIDEMSKEEINELSNEKELKIVTVARLVESYKGYDLAVKAAKLLKDDGYNFKWYAVGDGVDKEKIKRIIKENNLESYFILIGSKDNPYPYMKKCDIYVQPSRAEGFGLTVIEAKILKKPIVCTAFSTAKELIKSEFEGLIVDINEIAIYEGLKRYIDNNNLKESIIENLRVIDKYSSLKEINKIYKEIEA